MPGVSHRRSEQVLVAARGGAVLDVPDGLLHVWWHGASTHYMYSVSGWPQVRWHEHNADVPGWLLFARRRVAVSRVRFKAQVQRRGRCCMLHMWSRELHSWWHSNDPRYMHAVRRHVRQRSLAQVTAVAYTERSLWIV